MVRLDRPRRTADGDRNKSRRDRDRAPDDGGECRCGGVRARRCRGDFPRPGEWRWPLVVEALPAAVEAFGRASVNAFRAYAESASSSEDV